MSNRAAVWGIVLLSVIAFLGTLYGFESILWIRRHRTNVQAAEARKKLRTEQSGKNEQALLPFYYAKAHPDADWLPLSGPSNSWSLGQNENGYWPKFKTDELGFNNPPGSHVPNPDIVLVGDSMVHGITIRNSENLAGQLRSDGFRVTNLGQGGSGPLLELAIFREYALPLHGKDLVWVFYSGNDFTDLEFEKGVKALSVQASRVVNPDVEARARRTDAVWTQFLNEVSPPEAQNNILQFLLLERTRSRLFVTKPQRTPRGDVDQIISIVRTAKAESEAAGSTFTFVYLPPAGVQTPFEVYSQDGLAVVQGLRAAGIRVVDFSEAIHKDPKPESLYSSGRIGGHYGPKGYALLAKTVAAAVRGAQPVESISSR